MLNVGVWVNLDSNDNGVCHLAHLRSAEFPYDHRTDHPAPLVPAEGIGGHGKRGWWAVANLMTDISCPSP
jgi:hypothetical protein